MLSKDNLGLRICRLKYYCTYFAFSFLNLINILFKLQQSIMLIVKPKTNIQAENMALRWSLANHLKILFNFAYFVGCSPVKFVWEERRKGKFIRETWRPQQILCAISHILCIVMVIAYFRMSYSKQSLSTWKPTFYFSFGFGVTQIIYKGVTMKRFWLNSQRYLDVLQTILNADFLLIRTLCITRLRYICALYYVIIIKAVVLVVTGYKVVLMDKWSPSWWFRRLVVQGHFAFWFSSNISNTPEWDAIDFWDACLGVLAGLANFARFLMSEVCNLTILASSVTMWTVTNTFAIGIRNMQKDNNAWSTIYTQFQAIQDLSVVINDALGSQVFWFLADALMYYSVRLNVLQTANDMMQRIAFLFTFAVITGILYISADICVQMRALKSWLMKRINIKSAPLNEAYLVLHEDIAKEIGIRGNNTFTITFSFVAGYVSLIVTFFIICIEENRTG